MHISNLYRALTFLALAVLISQPIHAQDEIFEVDHITIEDGFPNRFCDYIAVDNLGQIWSSSKNELIRYNGFDFEKFDYSNSKLTKGLIVGLHYYNDELYVFQRDQNTDMNLSYSKTNIFIFDFSKNQFVEFKQRFPELEIEYVRHFCERGDQFIVVDQSNKLIDLVEQKPISESTIPSYDNIVGLNKSNLLFFIKGRDLFTLDLLSGKTEVFMSDFYDEYYGWFLDDIGNMFFKSTKTNQVHFREYSNLDLYHYPSNPKADIKSLELQYFSQSQNIKNKNEIDGKKILSLESNKFFQKIGIQPLLISDFTIKGNIIYAATSNGLLLVKPSRTGFKKFASYDHKLNATRKGVFSDDLLIYKEDDKEAIVSPSGKYETSFIKEDQKFNGVISYFQEEENKHRVWSSGWFNNSLRLVDFEKKEVIFPEKGKYKDVNFVGLTKSPVSQKIFTHSRYKLFYVDRELVQEDLNWAKYNAESGVEIVDIFSGPQEIWIGTLHGLISYNDVTGEIYRDPVFDKLPNIGVSCMHIDKLDDNIIWIGTKLEGLLKWNISNGDIKRYTKEDGLENQRIHSIYEDNLGRLWLPTDKYLHCFDKAENRFFIFSEKDGVSNNEFNRFGFSENKDQSEIILASLNGYTVFNPDSISTGEKGVHKLNLLYGTVANSENQKTNLTTDELSKKYINIESDKSSLELCFGLNPVINSDLNSFYFRINSENGSWNKMNSNKINLFTIPYGKNILEVQANVNQPENISNILKVEIYGKKPIHKTNWFWLLCTIFLFGLAWAFFSLRLRVIKSRNKRLELEIDKRTKDLQEANAKRQKLFTILSHDLRSPLVSLSNITKKLRFLEKKNRMNEFHDLATDTENRVNTLNDNLSNILFWASKETNEIQISKTQINIYTELEKLIELYATEALDHGVDIVNYVEKDLILNFDKAVFQTVLRNAIQNAVKYSATNAPIEISCNSIKTHMIITIKNRHKQEEESNTIESTRMGLQITEELAKLANSRTELKINVAGKTYFNFYISKEEN